MDLEEYGMPRDSGPIAVMLYEHRLGREHVAGMQAALPGSRAGEAGAWASLLREGRSYIDLIRGHILKEDHVLFEMADRIVGGERRARLCAAYDGTCHHAFEGCTKAQLEALGE